MGLTVDELGDGSSPGSASARPAAGRRLRRQAVPGRDRSRLQARVSRHREEQAGAVAPQDRLQGDPGRAQGRGRPPQGRGQGPEGPAREPDGPPAPLAGRPLARSSSSTTRCCSPFATRLVWGAYDTDHKLVGTFRALEDRRLTTPADEPFDLSGAASIGIVHPLELDDETRTAWQTHLADYEIARPSRSSSGPVHPGDDDQRSREDRPRAGAAPASMP